MKPDFGGEPLKSSFTSRKKKQSNWIDFEASSLNSTRNVSEKSENNQSDPSPVCSSDLVVQKKKIAEVKQWLELAYSSGNQVCLHIFIFTLEVIIIVAHFHRLNSFS